MSEASKLNHVLVQSRFEIRTYIFLLRDPRRCSVEINVFELGGYYTKLDGVIGYPLARTPLLICIASGEGQ